MDTMEDIFMGSELAEFVQLDDNYLYDTLLPDEDTLEGIPDMVSEDDCVCDTFTFINANPL